MVRILGDGDRLKRNITTRTTFTRPTTCATGSITTTRGLSSPDGTTTIATLDISIASTAYATSLRLFSFTTISTRTACLLLLWLLFVLLRGLRGFCFLFALFFIRLCLKFSYSFELRNYLTCSLTLTLNLIWFLGSFKRFRFDFGASLLNRVSQFVSKEFFPFARVRRVFTRIEINIFPMSESLSAEFLAQLDSIGASMNIDTTKIIAKPRFHEIAGFIWQRLTAAFPTF